MKPKPAKRRARSILVTAGPTRERIDPVRFISNYSTGRFGYEIAKEAKRRGYSVTLISGPSALPRPGGVRFIGVESALQMRRSVSREAKRCGLLIMAAAVCDWRVRKSSASKIKRRSGKKRLDLIENPDILAEAAGKKDRPVLVGFALETEDLEKNAFKKLRAKGLDLVVANRSGRASGVFGDRAVDILILDRFGSRMALRRKSKTELAKIILDKALRFNI